MYLLNTVLRTSDLCTSLLINFLLSQTLKNLHCDQYSLSLDPIQVLYISSVCILKFLCYETEAVYLESTNNPPPTHTHTHTEYKRKAGHILTTTFSSSHSIHQTLTCSKTIVSRASAVSRTRIDAGFSSFSSFIRTGSPGFPCKGNILWTTKPYLLVFRVT